VLTALKDDCGSGYAAIFLCFIFLSNLTMLNMLIGFLCEVVTRVKEEESENTAKEELETRVLDILECYDVEDDRHLRKPEFSQMMSNPDLMMILRDHDIDTSDLVKLEDVLFEEQTIDGEGVTGDGIKTGYKELSFDDFLEKVLQLRGGNMATVTDIVELRGYLNRKFSRVEERLLATLPPPPSADPCAPPPGRPWHASSSTCSLTSQPPEPSSGSCEPSLPGQIRTPTPPAVEPKSMSPDAAFQDAVLSQLSLLRVGQEMLRGEVTDLHNKVQALQQAVPALGSASGTSDASGAG